MQEIEVEMHNNHNCFEQTSRQCAFNCTCIFDGLMPVCFRHPPIECLLTYSRQPSASEVFVMLSETT